MEFLPRTLGTRPRLACELRAEGVVAARAEDASAQLSAVSRVPLPDPVADRTATVSALRKALEAVALRSREVTLIVPDSAVRVLLLDFDALPTKPAEALPIVRFRLKKLLPFDADDAAISFQIMATSKGSVSVVAVAMPRDVLADHEAMVREAGFEPGAILPSTLAAIAGLPQDESPVLIVNAGHQGVTTAIVKAGLLLLHRTVDLGADLRADQNLIDRTPAHIPASQPPLAPVFVSAGGVEVAIENEGGAESLITEKSYLTFAEVNDLLPGDITAPDELDHLMTTTSEIAQAVSVAAAYFEDTLQTTPRVVLAAGTLGADALAAVLEQAGVGPVRVVEMVDATMLGPGAGTIGSAGRVPLGWLAGVRGALTA
jgi:type IV pilus assembly protein PilM